MQPTPEYRRRRRFVDYGIAVQLLVIVLIGAPLAFWSLDRRPPLLAAEGRAVTETVYPGQMLVVEWTLTFGRACPGRSYRRLRDGYFVDIPDMELAGRVPADKLGEPWKIRQSIQIPRSLPAGLWYFEARPEYVCNLVHRLFPVHGNLPPIPFLVLSRDPESM